MDWSEFDLAMTDSRYLHWVPVFRDEPRIPVQAILDNLDDGMTPGEVAEAYQIDVRHIAVLEKHPEKLVYAVDAASEGSYEFVI